VAWERVLVNLFLNAVQAMPRGGVIEIRAWCEEREAVVEVTDSGPGIPAEVLPHIFKPHSPRVPPARSGPAHCGFDRPPARRLGGRREPGRRARRHLHHPLPI